MTSMPDPSHESEVLPRVPATPTAPLPDDFRSWVRAQLAERFHRRMWSEVDTGPEPWPLVDPVTDAVLSQRERGGHLS